MSENIVDRYRLVFDRAPRQEAPIAIRQIIEEVAISHGFSWNDVLSARRTNKLARVRHEAFWRARNETTHSLPAIGRAFNRDHTSVMYGIAKHEERMASLTTAHDPKANISRCIAKATPLAPISVQNISLSNNNHST